MENPEEILHSLEEFSKLRPKDIPRELEEYLCFVAKTGDPIYQWSSVKSLFREKLISVITEFYESCPSVEIPPCPNVDVFNYEIMKNFILEKLDTFAAAPFTVQRICELLTTPRKEYNRIDKYMRALEKNILVVSTTEPGNRRSPENGESIMNGIDSENGYDTNNSSNDINVEEMDDVPAWPRLNQAHTHTDTDTDTTYQAAELAEPQSSQPVEIVQETFISESSTSERACTSNIDTVITKSNEPYVSIEPIESDTCTRQEAVASDVSITITAIPAAVQKRRDSIEPVVSSEQPEQVTGSLPSTSEKEAEPDKVELSVPEVDVKPLISIESSITSSESELSADSCSELTSTYALAEAESSTPQEETTDPLCAQEPEQLPEPQAESTENCETNFLITSVAEAVPISDDNVTSEVDNSAPPFVAVTDEETKTDLISSSDEVRVETANEDTDTKAEELREETNEAETVKSPEPEPTVPVQVSTLEEPTESTVEAPPADEAKEAASSLELPMDVDVDEQLESKSEETVL